MRIGVVGTGYVDQLQHVVLLNRDILLQQLKNTEISLNCSKRESSFFEEGLEEILQNNLTNDRISFTSDLTSALEDISTVIIAVGTPSLPDGRVDLSQVNDVAQEIARNAKNELIVVMKSTVPPGTGNSLCKRFFFR